MQEISADICGDINLIDSFCLGLKVYELSAFSALSKSENVDNVDCSDMEIYRDMSFGVPGALVQ